MKNKKPKIFVIEGIDGSGKTTQCRLIFRELRRRKISVTCLKNPNNNILGNFIRENVNNFGHPLKSEMFILDILVTLENSKIKTDVVLWDRYAESIYTSNKEETLKSSLPLIKKVPSPTKTFVLDITPEEIIKRKRAIREDTIDFNWQKQKYERYQVLLKHYPNKYIRIDATQTPPKIMKQIADIIEKEVKKNKK